MANAILPSRTIAGLACKAAFMGAPFVFEKRTLASWREELSATRQASKERLA